MSWHDRVIYGWDAVKEIIGREWVYVLIGIALGAGIHGFVPEQSLRLDHSSFYQISKL